MRKGDCGIKVVFKFSIDMRSGPGYNEFQENADGFSGFWWGVPRIERSFARFRGVCNRSNRESA